VLKIYGNFSGNVLVGIQLIQLNQLAEEEGFGPQLAGGRYPLVAVGMSLVYNAALLFARIVKPGAGFERGQISGN
jgi:hypothetical protein